MTQKVGRRGPFWGCVRFPVCKGSASYDPSDDPLALAGFGRLLPAPEPGPVEELQELQPVWLKREDLFWSCASPLPHVRQPWQME
jgi:ssDNA-binding Zn-finger/Zn-ribbon topoisomerase 1